MVTSAKQLRAISSPGRDEIIDMVGTMGPCTVSELARLTGRSRNALYYHVRALTDCGLLIELRPPGNRNGAVARYKTPGHPVFVRFDLTTKSTRKAVLALVAARMRGASRGFRRACRPDIAVVDGPQRNLWGTRWAGWLSTSELEEANKLFFRLIELLKAGQGTQAQKRKYYELTFIFAPIVPQPDAD